MKRNNKYVVSIIKKYGDKMVEVFLSRDDHAGTYSSGYPCWDSLYYAIEFSSVEEARKRFFQDKKYLFNHCDTNDFIMESLAIKEIKLETILYL